MPMYEYKCRACENRFEELVFNSDARVVCPKCGSDQADKLVSTFASSSLAHGGSCTSGNCHKSGFG